MTIKCGKYMTTSELIELADYCNNTHCAVCKHWGGVNCWGTFDLIEQLRNRLEEVYHDLGKSECVTCKCAKECSAHDRDCDEKYYLEWLGDE